MVKKHRRVLIPQPSSPTIVLPPMARDRPPSDRAIHLFLDGPDSISSPWTRTYFGRHSGFIVVGATVGFAERIVVISEKGWSTYGCNMEASTCEFG